jgi:hydroxyacylglutathione hydrolase
MKVHTVQGRGFSGNVFLVDSKRPCLVDAGWSSDIGYAAKTLEGVLGGRELAHIILTHRHIDHVGGALSFQKRFGGDILVHELDADALREGDPVSTGARLFGGEISPMEVMTLKEGDDIDLGGTSLEVLHTPGHTVGSVCLLSDGVLFSGDTVFADGGVGRWDLETGDYGQLLASVERLSALDVDELYPGHGPAVLGDANEHIRFSLRGLGLFRGW